MQLPSVVEEGKEWYENRERGVNLPPHKGMFDLSAMAQDWMFFNHGALFSYSEFKYPESDPVFDWYQKLPPRTPLVLQPYKTRMFYGLDAEVSPGVTWNNVICAIPHKFGGSLLDALASIAAVNPKTNSYYRTYARKVTTVDPVFVERNGDTEPPMIPVWVICVGTLNESWEPSNLVAGSCALPSIAKRPANPDIVKEMQALSEGNPGTVIDALLTPLQSQLREQVLEVAKNGPKIILRSTE